MINAERLVRTFIELCRIPSPSRYEGRLAQYIRARATGLGLEVEEDQAGTMLGSETGNLLVRTPGSGAALFLCAHMDTQPVAFRDEVPVVVDGDRIHTAGQSVLGGDDKSGVALALEMMHLGREQPQNYPPLEFVFTIQEEVGLMGARAFETDRLQAKLGYVLDGETSVGTAIRGASYKARYTIEVHGRSAHAAIEPERGINALQAAGAIAAVLPSGKLEDDSVANLGRMEGGGPTNIVPEKAHMVGEARSMRSEALEKIKVQIEDTARQQAERFGAFATVAWEELYAGYYIATEAGSIKLFRQACQAVGLQPELLTSLGGGDANRFNARGRECIVPGLSMENIHTPQESMLASKLVQAGELLDTLLRLRANA